MLISLFYFVVVLQLVRFGKCVGPDYVANFSLASETNPLKKSNWPDYMENDSAPAGSNSAQANGPKNLKKM